MATQDSKKKGKAKTPKAKGLAYMAPNANAGESGKQVNLLINKAIKAAGSYRNAAQIALVAIALHAYNHGDWTGIQRMTDELPDGVGKNGIVKWANKFIGLELVEVEGQQSKRFGNWKGREHIERLFNGDPKATDKFEKAGAKATFFWEFAEPNPFAGYDINDEIRRVRARYDAMVKRASDPKTTPAERALMKMDVNEDAMKTLLAVAKFEVIVSGQVVPHVVPTPADKVPETITASAAVTSEQAAPIQNAA